MVRRGTRNAIKVGLLVQIRSLKLSIKVRTNHFPPPKNINGLLSVLVGLFFWAAIVMRFLSKTTAFLSIDERVSASLLVVGAGGGKKDRDTQEEEEAAAT